MSSNSNSSMSTRSGGALERGELRPQRRHLGRGRQQMPQLGRLVSMPLRHAPALPLIRPVSQHPFAHPFQPAERCPQLVKQSCLRGGLFGARGVLLRLAARAGEERTVACVCFAAQSCYAVRKAMHSLSLQHSEGPTKQAVLMSMNKHVCVRCWHTTTSC